MARPTIPPERRTKLTTAMQHIYRFPIPTPPPTPDDSTTATTTATAIPAAWTPPPASAGHRGRYLWTDAFGLLNLLALHHLTSSTSPPPRFHHCSHSPAPASSPYLAYATTLATAVHDTLGRARNDNDADGPSSAPRLPGATDADPLGGGLRIGKEADEGAPDGDGQYFHYLALWANALARLGVAWRGEEMRKREKGMEEEEEEEEEGKEGKEEEEGRKWIRLAVRLMEAVHPAFVHGRGGRRPRMVWKAGVGLDRVLVASEGNLDPVDGLGVCRVLRGLVAAGEGEAGAEADVLGEEMRDFEAMVRTKWRTYGSDDPLDLGMTLWTAHRFAGKEEWATGLLERAKRDLRALIERGYFRRDVGRRLAFREFGTVLGIRCALAGEQWWEDEAEKIIKTWEDAGVVPVPKEDAAGNINASPELVPITLVMYAAALEPGAFKHGWLERV